RRAIRYGNGWIPNASRSHYADVTEFLPGFREMATSAGRDPASISVTIWGVPEDLDRIKRYREQGIDRVVVSLPSEDRNKILPALDRWADLIRKTAN
ncbi:MAG: LLM class F420-dependent oxidoreductase, partial [Alphaproteobacteria bacterium]|nr:LLM class F420-dependent oxidoreductase [Alphaproteobacteria bacterium]